jgi:alpha-L-fucosidase
MLSLSIVCIGCAAKSPTMTEPAPDTGSSVESPPIESTFPTPSGSQLQWQNSKIELFTHFGINTFTNKEWGDGTEDPALFNPTAFDANQWVAVAKSAGFEYLILTAKHHDGFCLWPSKYTDHSVKNSPYKNGHGDIVNEVALACKKGGIKFGFYLSPWDRHDSTYGTDAYNTYYCNQLAELLTNYGEISEVWLDGANGEGPNGKQQNYDWARFYSTIKHYQPDALIAVMGPDIRWVGNEDGLGSETEWSFALSQFPQQNTNGQVVWWPSECDVSIRPGWFYHASEDAQIKTTSQLVDIYFKSVGRNSNLLLNVPPNTQGLISNADVQQLAAWHTQLKSIFEYDLFANSTIQATNTRDDLVDYSPYNCIDHNSKTFWTTAKDTTTADITIITAHSITINIIQLEEVIEYGQRISSFVIYADQNGQWNKVLDGTTVGRTRLLQFPTVNTSKIKISITGSLAAPALSTIAGYYTGNN